MCRTAEQLQGVLLGDILLLMGNRTSLQRTSVILTGNRLQGQAVSLETAAAVKRQYDASEDLHFRAKHLIDLTGKLLNAWFVLEMSQNFLKTFYNVLKLTF